MLGPWEQQLKTSTIVGYIISLQTTPGIYIIAKMVVVRTIQLVNMFMSSFPKVLNIVTVCMVCLCN